MEERKILLEVIHELMFNENAWVYFQASGDRWQIRIYDDYNGVEHGEKPCFDSHITRKELKDKKVLTSYIYSMSKILGRVTRGRK